MYEALSCHERDSSYCALLGYGPVYSAVFSSVLRRNVLKAEAVYLSETLVSTCQDTGPIELPTL
jgi:hypothetical protein